VGWPPAYSNSSGSQAPTSSPSAAARSSPSAAAAAAAAAVGADHASAAHWGQRDPLVALLVSEVWPLAQAVCLEGASGRFLNQYAKSTALLLKACPEQLPPLLPQMFAVCGVCFCRPGGYSLGEVMAGAIVAYCRVEGSKAPLDCAPHLLQVRVWAWVVRVGVIGVIGVGVGWG